MEKKAMSAAAATSIRLCVIVLVATVMVVAPGRLQGTGEGNRAVGARPGTAAVAHAGDEWSDGDPVRLIQTQDGRLLPVAIFYTPGARVRSLLDLSRIVSLLRGTLLHVHSSSEPVDGGTRVSLQVTVPTGFGEPFPTRLVVSSGPFGTLTRYDEVSGTSGQPMVAEFVLPDR